MDRLSELPVKGDTVKTDEESEIINHFFPGGSTQGPQQGQQHLSPIQQGNSSSSNSTLMSKLNWKLIGMASILFVVLANPWIDSLFCKMPYCGENAAALFGIKTLLFVIIMTMIILFC